MNQILFILFSILLYTQINHTSELINYRTIAHAGGGIDNKTYTNSIKALDLNYKKGFRYFEIDFSFTSDDKLVCLHDWKEDISYSFNTTITKPSLTLEEFEKLNETYSYKKCTINTLIKWLDKHPNSFIITDVKDNNIKALKQIKQKSTSLFNRFIPQIYAPEDFKEVKDLGYEKVILTLYRYRGTSNELFNSIENFYGNVSITIPTYRLNRVLINRLKEKGFPIYTHTINNSKEFNYLKNMYSIDNIYTDFLAPSN